VDKTPVYLNNWENGILGGKVESHIQDPSHSFMVRDDLDATNPDKILGIVGNKFFVLQNNECFAIADDFVGEGGANFETAGSLKNGKLVYLLAVLPDTMKVQDDEINKYLLIKHAHDGSCALEIAFTPVRVVCMNTLRAAISGARARSEGGIISSVKIKHTLNMDVRINDAKSVLGKAHEYFTEISEIFNNMATKKVNERFVNAYLLSIIPDTDNQKRDNCRSENIRNRIKKLFMGNQAGAGMDAVRGTAYGLHSALTQYLEYDQQRHVGKEPTDSMLAESRMIATMFNGSAEKLRQTSFNLLRDTDRTQALADAGELTASVSTVN